ncbi:glycoside hydrolase family 9 protein [Prolixibacteraceae bacterium Z1-6]|uniref:Glycoside hydrolase family 9 protein n=1 Tax=Draconibacterium aestuarii TaxID=2998507 RepID=A0A9X3FB45_9BACT|nr:glycoside hydrolase family 9 protein [Prolixibacteraceae bacterium Z1-6]
MILILMMGCQYDRNKKIESEELESSVFSFIPLEHDTINSLQTTWNKKDILKERLVDKMESLDRWQGNVFVPGSNKITQEKNAFVDFSLSEKQVFEGSYSIKLKTPTRTESPMQPEQRMWNWIFLTRLFDNEDFSDYTRISAKIYPDCSGHRKIHLLMILQNDTNVPDKYLREGIHTAMLENNKWNDVVFEIPHLKRDEVKSISFVYRQQGNEIDATDTVVFYIDRLALQKAETEHFESWNTNNDISFSHTGYNSSDSKTAITSLTGIKTFKLLSHPDNKIILTKEVEHVEGIVGEFSVLDFSEVTKEGMYKLVYDSKTTKPFKIQNDVWRNTLLKTINFFFCERCGDEVEGVHQVCHSDWYTVSDQDTVFLNGGWHDAGDLSQSYTDTAEATGTMFRLARKFEEEDPKLSKRFIEEAMWGLKWLHKNRFEDGQKVTWTVIDHWSDGIVGNDDDKLAYPKFNAKDNRCSVIAEVEAFKILQKRDPALAEKCLKYAIEDWFLTEQRINPTDIATLARGVWAGCALFEVSKEEDVKQTIIKYADKLMQCQQKTPMDWKIPLSGFFYNNAESDVIFVQRHVVSLISPILGLTELCKLFPENEKYEEWHTSIKLYAEYLKSMSAQTAPYYMIPTCVYKLGSSDDEQIKKGIPMDENYYLRMFPVWESSRGNSPVILSYAIGLAQANKILNDSEIDRICQAQMEWIVGKNPFNQSQMYGEGYNYSPLFSAPCDDIVGGLPVGIQTRAENDVPYWQPAVLYNYKEVWVHVSSRWLYLLESLYYN